MEIKNKEKQRLYVVFKGMIPGIYSTCEECAPHVLGFRGSLYKSFKSEEEAIEAHQAFFEGRLNEETLSNDIGVDFVHSMAGNCKWKKEKRKRFYVVFKGNRPGVYFSWDECAPYVIGFSGSLYKSFKTKDEVVAAFYAFFDGNQNEEGSSSVRSIGTFVSDLNTNSGKMEDTYAYSSLNLFILGCILD
ncbi:uncharacterized protein LOC127788602 [Diospyros lotus]|uniref:uncharacterized protein LOC127788602 n=1 Tax=Diospyros lotus TaxID=55363 RepID=UPI00224F2DBF|nr:uncharacterized protein LOC127788602 [Diospyros lotus]